MSEDPHFQFKHGLSVSKLQEGVEFEIDQDAEEEESSEDEYFNDESSNAFKEELAKVCSGEYENEIDLSALPLDKLKERMVPLTEDKLVLKLEIKCGTGTVIPSKSIVLLHYNAFIEGQTEPFDSTYRRGIPHRFLLNGGRVIYGLDISVNSMRKDEFSKFWIHSDYAFGPMGCPPRIPQNCNILYEVELVNYIDSSAAIEFEEMTPEDQKNAPFEQVYNVCKVEHQAGNDMFNNKKYPGAASRYQRARRFLESVSAKDEQEDQKRQALLLKLYLNLSICFLKLKKARRTIYFSRNALQIATDDKNARAKAYYYLGQANMMDNEYEKARECLLEAKKLQPYDEMIAKAFVELEKRGKKYEAVSKEFCRRMFGLSIEDQNDKAQTLESPEFIEAIKEKVEEFKDSSEEEYTFPSTFTPSQIDVIRYIAREEGIYFFEKIFQGEKVIKIKKNLS